MTQPLIAPRLTPPPPSSGSGKTVRLPQDVVDEQVRRVRLFAGVSAFMWSFGFMMDAAVFPRALGVSVPRSALLVEAIAVTLAIAIFVVLRFVPW